MKDDDKLKAAFGNQGGWTVPEGYFESFAEKMMAQLPEVPEAPKQIELSRWQRVKPYAYLAAMFAGIWLMMNVFHRVSSMTERTGEATTAQIAQVIEEPMYSDFYLSSSSDADVEVEHDVRLGYESIDDFKRDFAKID